jgi:Arc/MetJ-type ribon-helix-helix transcriptional regulator
MTIHVPQEIENAINAAVQSGLFASPDDAIAKAWHYFEQRQLVTQTLHGRPSAEFDPILGSASDHAELLDQIVEDAMQRREQRPLRLDTHE